ncbi:7454_t:CDS:1 [Ambispora leptoticha]|uniref:7454_t:CDS:1 n=1 Tax=Ambispora leptoticha TaxID=144679 RepID=A0A9N9GBG8_9GLOM|nr:7454_t:CDS:1 [Ambispora leptoticha]
MEITPINIHNDNDKLNKKIPNYEKAVKDFFTNIETGDLYDYTDYVLNFLKTTDSKESKMIEYLSSHCNSQNQVILGAIYLEMDEAKKAFQEFKKAAEMNNPHGQYFLGHCYEIGIGIAEDDETSVYWKKKAANQGIPAACYFLGYHYEQGEGVRVNKRTAFILFRKAFESGYSAASLELAMTYDEGAGTLQNTHKAIYWYRKSIKDGDVNAYDYLRDLLRGVP